MDSILIATLGAEAQVITLALHSLLSQGADLRGVVVLHTRPDGPPVDAALARLAAAWADATDWPPLLYREIPVADILGPDEMETFAATLFTTLKEWVAQGVAVHLLLAGGRKPMAMVGMSVAQMVLGEADRVWYLHSEEALRRSGRMTPDPADRVTLIQVPLPPQSPASPVYTASFQAGSPQAARAALADAQQRRRSHFVDHELTRAEREVALLVAREVLTVDQMAGRLHKAPKTVANQLNSIYSKLEAHFDLQPESTVKREFLRRELAPYLAAAFDL